ASRGSATFIGDFLLLGRRDRLTRVIDLLASGQSLKNAPPFVEATRLKEPAAMKSYNWVGEETGEMMATIARWIHEKGKKEKIEAQLDSLPLAVSATSVNDQGILVESHSPFGNIPSVMSIVAGVTNGK